MVILLVSVSLALFIYFAVKALTEWQRRQSTDRLIQTERKVDSSDSLGIDIAGLINSCRNGILRSYFTRKRINLIESQLPDLTTFLSAALKASLSVRQALEEAALDLPPPISEEISQMVSELSMGLTLNQVLENLGVRVPLDDVNLLSAALITASSSGGNLILALENLASTVRQRLYLKREVQVLTAQGRYSGIILSALPIGVLVFLTISSPQNVQKLLSLPVGWLILLVGLGLNLLGFLLIRKITDIEI